MLVKKNFAILFNFKYWISMANLKNVILKNEVFGDPVGFTTFFITKAGFPAFQAENDGMLVVSYQEPNTFTPLGTASNIVLLQN